MNENILSTLTESLTELSENHGLNMFAQDDMARALAEDATKSAMIDGVLQESGFTAFEKEHFAMIAEHTIEDFITEASTSQDIKPYAPFQITLLKEIYARRIGRRLLSHEMMKTTTEKFGVFETVIEDADGVVTKLSEIDTSTDVSEGWKTKTATVDTLFEGLDAANLTAAEQAVANPMIDISSKVTEFVVSVGAVPAPVTFPCDVQIGEDGAFNAVVEYADQGVDKLARIYGRVDYKTGEFIFHSAVAGEVETVGFTYRLTNNFMEINDLQMRIEYNPNYKVSIGDGTLINAAIPMNYLQDIKAFTQVDGLAMAVKRLAESLVVLDDVKVLKMANTAGAQSGNTEVFTKYAIGANANISIVDYNRALLHSVNQCIAKIDNKHQFTAVGEYNVAANPIDASTLFSPVVLTDPKVLDNSLISGSFGYNTTSVVTAVGNVNILSTKIQAQDSMVVVPKSTSAEEKIFTDYMYSSVLLTDSSYRNKSASLVKNLSLKERKETVVHEKGMFGLVTLTA